jgi:hypothetical protein
MLSIIICSINNDFLNRIKKSIFNSVKVPYEIIVFDNTDSKLPITKTYNLSALKARYDNLVFVHEDVEFLNYGWDKNIIRILQDLRVGIVGIAGSTYLPSVPSGWYLLQQVYNHVFIHQGFKYDEQEVRFDNHGEDLTSVYLLDGVFLAMRKDIWKRFEFNEKLNGFHAYDVDICQRVSAYYQNVFTNQIEILHHSEGNVDKTYFDTILHYKKQYLDFDYKKRNYEIEYVQLLEFYKQLRCHYDKHDCKEKIRPFIKLKYLGFRGYFSFKKMLMYAK